MRRFRAKKWASCSAAAHNKQAGICRWQLMKPFVMNAQAASTSPHRWLAESMAIYRNKLRKSTSSALHALLCSRHSSNRTQ
jgi:hypothetical protein